MELYRAINFLSPPLSSSLFSSSLFSSPEKFITAPQGRLPPPPLSSLPLLPFPLFPFPLPSLFSLLLYLVLFSFSFRVAFFLSLLRLLSSSFLSFIPCFLLLSSPFSFPLLAFHYILFPFLFFFLFFFPFPAPFFYFIFLLPFSFSPCLTVLYLLAFPLFHFLLFSFSFSVFITPHFECSYS